MKSKLKRTSSLKKCVFQLKRHLPILGHINLRGGARYTEKNPKDAKKILDSSQNGKSHPRGNPGHPRGHAYNPKATGPTSSVQNYSKFDSRKPKTGFLSPDDQDFVAHLVLKHKNAEKAMNALNDSKNDVILKEVKMPAKMLNISENKLPKVQDWFKGKRTGEPGRISRIVMVLKHFYERSKDKKADVFVLTFYPEL